MSVEWRGPAWLRRPAERLGVRIYHRATKLGLDGPKYDDTAIEYLAKLTSLQSLTLSRTSISNAGLKRLSQALPNCQVERLPL